MKTIYKYPIQPSVEEIVLKIPGGGPVFSAGLDAHNKMCVWAFADTEEKEKPVTIYCIGTGWATDWIVNKGSTIQFIGTVKQGVFMWHIFMEVK